jgi:FkbM family methyltransferase
MIQHEISKFLISGDIYFDLGAHKGEKAEIFIGKGVKSILVEPQPDLILILKDKYLNNTMVEIVPMGVGESFNVLEMSINSTEPVLSTFSEEWKLGRFEKTIWDKRVDVQITTIDFLIKKYGHPRYIKIDVEGFEFQALKGLTSKTGIISFEFTAEYINNAIKCVKYLDSLGYKHFNISLGESVNFALESFLDKENIINILRSNSIEHKLLWGDVYAN